jgi:RNA polymerase sigma-70 factor (ECF subfamily)
VYGSLGCYGPDSDKRDRAGKDVMSKSPAPTRYSSLSLKDVVSLCAGAPDDEAWEEFVSRVGKPLSLIVMRTASRWGSPPKTLVEDLVQVTYLKLWEGGRRLLHEFALQHPEAILGYLKKTAANATHDYFKHRHSQSSGGDQSHISTSDLDPVAGNHAFGSQEAIDREIFFAEIDELLKRCTDGPDQERDRTIFWLYFRHGMSTREIASLPTIELTAKGVGSVIERLKYGIRERIAGDRIDLESFARDEEDREKEIP